MAHTNYTELQSQQFNNLLAHIQRTFIDKMGYLPPKMNSWMGPYKMNVVGCGPSDIAYCIKCNTMFTKKEMRIVKEIICRNTGYFVTEEDKQSDAYNLAYTVFRRLLNPYEYHSEN
jgi:hypothetical protein